MIAQEFQERQMGIISILFGPILSTPTPTPNDSTSSASSSISSAGRSSTSANTSSSTSSLSRSTISTSSSSSPTSSTPSKTPSSSASTTSSPLVVTPVAQQTLTRTSTIISRHSSSATPTPISFLQNKVLSGVVFGLVGLVGFILLMAIAIYLIRRRRRMNLLLLEAVKFDPVSVTEYNNRHTYRPYL